MKFNILLVDNDTVFSAGCREYLESAGYKVYEADSIEKARARLETSWLHLMVVDVRLSNDNDPTDKTGLELASEIAPVLPTLILTRYPDHEDATNAMKMRIPGKRAVVDYVYKKKPLDVLLRSIQDMIERHVDLNVGLKIEWKACNRYSLVSYIDPDLVAELIPDRSSEMEDLLRKLFKNDTIRLNCELWHEAGRVGLGVFAFEAETAPESYVFVCGERKKIEEELKKFEKYSPKLVSETGTALIETSHTIHYAAIKYLLNNNNLDKTLNLSELYKSGPEKSFHNALDTLFVTTLRAWHRNKQIHIKNDTGGSVHKELIEALTKENLKSRASAIEDQASTLGFQITPSGEKLKIKIGGRSFPYADPLRCIPSLISKYPLELGINSPGKINGENVLTDDGSHVWLTNFGGAGLASPGWNIAEMESVVRFDWLDISDFTQRFEFEHNLEFSDFYNPDTRDLVPPCRKASHAIAEIRKYYEAHPTHDLNSYQYFIFLQAAQRLLDFDPAFNMTGLEMARMAQIWLAMIMLADKLENVPKTEPEDDRKNIIIKDKRARTFLVGANEKSLPPQPFALLLFLCENPDRVCTHEELIEKVLKGEYDKSYLHKLIGRVREAIGEDADHPVHLLTISNAGYRFKPQL